MGCKRGVFREQRAFCGIEAQGRAMWTMKLRGWVAARTEGTLSATQKREFYPVGSTVWSPEGFLRKGAARPKLHFRGRCVEADRGRQRGWKTSQKAFQSLNKTIHDPCRKGSMLLDGHHFSHVFFSSEFPPFNSISILISIFSYPKHTICGSQNHIPHAGESTCR